MDEQIYYDDDDNSPPLSPTQQVGKMKLDFKSDDDRHKKRQVRLEKNRKSAALSRNRKKEYIANLEAKAQELRLSTQEIQLAFSQLSNGQMETITHLERLDKQLGNILNENEMLKKKVNQFLNSSPISNINIKPVNQSPIIISNLNSPVNCGTIDIIKKKESSSDIIIGANKLTHLYNSKCNINDNDNDNHQQQQSPKPNNTSNLFNNNLSYSNPNVNSSPIYLTRARSSSYHPHNSININSGNGSISLNTNETLIAEALSNLTNITYNPNIQSPINNNKDNNSNESSPILPSLSSLTKNLVHSPSPSSPLSTISSPLGSLSLSPIQSPIISHSRSKKNPLFILTNNLLQNTN